MGQIIHIFRKDCRRFWPEILASLAITATFVWLYPYEGWLTDFTATTPFLDLAHLQILANVATGLMPVSWMLLIARVVHAENLVGHRQFWITRPYEWKKLLSAKLLFLTVFVYLPFLAAQMALLSRAGFQPFHYMPGLLFNLLLTSGILILPMLALATVTSNLLRMILTVLGAVVIVIVIAFFASGRDYAPSVSIPFSDRFSIPIVFCLAGSAVLSQYATRRLWLARTLLVLLPLSVAVVAINPFDIRMLEHFYPATDQFPGGADLNFAPSKNFDIAVWGGSGVHSEVAIPLRLSGLPDDLDFDANDVQLSIDAANGSHWTSRWESAYNARFDAESSSRMLSITVDNAFLGLIRNNPVTLHLQIAFTELQAGKTTLLEAPDTGEHLIGDWGLCSYSTVARDASWQLSCKLPLRQPPLMRIGPGRFPDSCKMHTRAWLGTLDRDPADFGLASVWTSNSSVGTEMVLNNAPPRCRDSDLRLTRYNLVRRFRYSVTIPNVTLPDAKNKPEYRE